MKLFNRLFFVMLLLGVSSEIAAMISVKKGVATQVQSSAVKKSTGNHVRWKSTVKDTPDTRTVPSDLSKMTDEELATRFKSLSFASPTNRNAAGDVKQESRSTDAVTQTRGSSAQMLQAARDLLNACKDPKKLVEALHGIESHVHSNEGWAELLCGLDLRTIKDKNNDTALHWAAVLGYDEVCKILLKSKHRKTMVKAKNTQGKTPFGLAALKFSRKGHKQALFECLLGCMSLKTFASEYGKYLADDDVIKDAFLNAQKKKRDAKKK